MRSPLLHRLAHPIVVACVIAAAAATAQAQKCCKPELHRESGLSVTTFQGDAGAIRVYLPDDMTAGDTISGTVVAAPNPQAGQASGQQAAGELTGYVVEIEGQQSGKDGRTSFRLPPAATQTMLVLRDKAGREVGRQAVPLLGGSQAGKGGYCGTHQLSHSDMATTDEYTQQGMGGGFLLPAIGQAGRPLQICGPFDGNLGNTSLTIGGRAARALAESPRKAVFQAPPDAAGQLPLQLSENGRTVQGQVQLLRVTLSAPRTTLRRGESTTLTVLVTGLAGLPQPVPLELVNQSTNVVTLEGGESQVVPINPMPDSDEVTLMRTVTGLQPGGFDIRAQVKIEAAPGSSAPAGGSKPAVSATGPGESSAPAPGSGAEPGPQVATGPGSETPVRKVGKPGDSTGFCAMGSVGKPTGKPSSGRPLLCRGTIEMLLAEPVYVPPGSDDTYLWGTFALNPTEAGESGEKLGPGMCAWVEASLDPPNQFLYAFSPSHPKEAQRASLIEHCASDTACVFELCAAHTDRFWLLDASKIRIVFPKF